MTLGVKLIIPDFKGLDRSQLSVREVMNSEQIVMARIHIQRIIQRIHNFDILDSTIKLSQKDVIEQVFTVCSYLVNFQIPIIYRRDLRPSLWESLYLAKWLL